MLCDSIPAGVDSGGAGNGGFCAWILQRSPPAQKGAAVMERLCARVTGTMRQLAGSRAEMVGATRFFRNRKVTTGEIVETAAARTALASAERHVLLIEDTTEINYEGKAGRKRGLGRVG